MSKIFKNVYKDLLIFIACFLAGFLGNQVYDKILVPSTVTERCKNLGLMTYDSKQDKFVSKSDTIILNKYELNYLITGTTKDKK